MRSRPLDDFLPCRVFQRGPKKIFALNDWQYYIVNRMGAGCRPKSKWVFAIVLSVICCGMFLTEAHGILGHSHPIPPNSTKPPEYSASSGPRLLAPERESDDPSCSLCYFYRLLGHGIVSQTHCMIDSPFAIRAILIHRLRLIEAGTPQAGNRSPPQA
jgi:hypothetical protein